MDAYNALPPGKQLMLLKKIEAKYRFLRKQPLTTKISVYFEQYPEEFLNNNS